MPKRNPKTVYRVDIIDTDGVSIASSWEFDTRHDANLALAMIERDDGNGVIVELVFNGTYWATK